jgi:archaellum biogenesis protein FlaJ (TadC family)
MLDPVSIIGIATTAFKGLKSAVEAGREIQDVMGQLSTWAGAIADLDKLDELNKKKKNNLFTSLIPKNGKSVEQEAMQLYTARVSAREQRSELMQMLGALQGERGQREFMKLEADIRKQRKQTAHAELERIQKLKDIGAVLLITVLAIGTLGLLLALILAIKETE